MREVCGRGKLMVHRSCNMRAPQYSLEYALLASALLEMLGICHFKSNWNRQIESQSRNLQAIRLINS
jgi:hypothetical protein